LRCPISFVRSFIGCINAAVLIITTEATYDTAVRSFGRSGC